MGILHRLTMILFDFPIHACFSPNPMVNSIKYVCFQGNLHIFVTYVSVRAARTFRRCTWSCTARHGRWRWRGGTTRGRDVSLLGLDIILYMYMYIHIYIYIYTYIHTYIYIHIYNYIHIYIYVYNYIYMYICIYVCIYVCIYQYTYIYTYNVYRCTSYSTYIIQHVYQIIYTYTMMLYIECCKIIVTFFNRYTHVNATDG